ncbi:MAG: hypothetical protein AAF560_22220, partial [Acidobacteriota bacterium]
RSVMTSLAGRGAPAGGLAQGLRAVGLVALLLLVSGCLHRGVTPIRTHFNKGVYHYSEGAIDDAISEYRLALEEEPADHRARFNLAEALEVRAQQLAAEGEAARAGGMVREAGEHYRRILTEAPGHLRATVNLAAHERATDPAAAEARLREAVATHPRSALPRVALAAHRLEDGSPQALGEAVQLLEEALDRDAGHVDARVLLGHALSRRAEAADGATRNELLGRARTAYRRALKGSSEDIGALLALARLERQAGQPEAALPWLRRALYVRSDLIEAHVSLAEILADRGELEQATVHLWQARQLEDAHQPHLEPGAYRERLLELYRRLTEQETR